MKRVIDTLTTNDYDRMSTYDSFGIFRHFSSSTINSVVGKYSNDLSNIYYNIRSGSKRLNSIYYNRIYNYIKGGKWLRFYTGALDNAGNVVYGRPDIDYITPFIPILFLKYIKLPANTTIYLYAYNKNFINISDWGKTEFSYPFGGSEYSFVRFFISSPYSNPNSSMKFEVADDYMINDYFNIITAKNVVSKFEQSWSKIIDVLINSQYDALDEIGEIVHKEIDDTKKFEHGLSITKTETRDFEKTFDDKLKIVDVHDKDYQSNNTRLIDTQTDIDELSETNDNETNSYYAFNSVNPVPTNKTEADGSTHTTASGTKNKTSTNDGTSITGKDDTTVTETHSGTQTTTDNGTGTISDRHTGTDTNSDKYTEDKSRNGRMHSPAELVEKELNLRNKNILFDIICRDIDSVLCLSIY